MEKELARKQAQVDKYKSYSKGKKKDEDNGDGNAAN